MKIEVNFDPESYAEFMNMDLDYVKENWDTIYPRLIEELNSIMSN
jgi:hypothetical protein